MKRIPKDEKLLHLFGAEAEGEILQPSVSTPQTNQDTGEIHEASAPAAGESTQERTRQEGFRALMEGEYKDLFTAYFQETFNRRFREQKEMKEELEHARTLLNAAAKHFGVEQAGLLAAIRAEDEKKSAPTASAAGEAAPVSEKTQRELQRAVDAAVAAACADTERKLLASIRARGLRPAESALAQGTGDALRGEASRLSRAQRAEVARRAAKGEHIKL